MIFYFVLQQNHDCPLITVLFLPGKTHSLLGTEISCLSEGSRLLGLAPHGWRCHGQVWSVWWGRLGLLHWFSFHPVLPFPQWVFNEGTTCPVCSPYTVMHLVLSIYQKLGSRGRRGLGFWKDVLWDTFLKLPVKALVMNVGVRWLCSPWAAMAWPGTLFLLHSSCPSLPICCPAKVKWCGLPDIVWVLWPCPGELWEF